MAEYLTERIVDLAQPFATVPTTAQFALGDNNAYTFTALVCNSREPDAGLMAGTVSGAAMRPDGVTVALDGVKGAETREVTVNGHGVCNATPCSVTLPQACFAYPGRVLVSIKLTEGTTATTVLAVTGTVVRTETDTAVDPGEIIPDLATLQAAAAEALDAAEAATAAADHAVQYDAAQSLTDAQQEQARENIGAEQAGVLEPWLETTTSYTDVSSERTSTNKKIINHNRNVASTDSSGYYVTDKFTVTPGDVYRLSWKMNYNNYLYVFYNSSDTAFGGVQAANSGTWTTLTNQLVTIPANAVAMRICYYSTFKLEKQSVDTELVADRVTNYPANTWYTDRLNGKRWVAIGDSITENNSTASAKYHKLIADATGITVINKGKSGTGYGKTYSTSENFCDRVLTLGSTECDVITIFGSFNDLSLDLGTASDPVSAGTIGGYMNGTLDNLFATLPNVSVGIILPTPWWGKTPKGGTTNSDKAIAYCEMLKTIAEKRSIPVLDLFHRSNLHPDDADFRTAFFDNADGTHPNNEGHKKIAPMVQKFLEELVW